MHQGHRLWLFVMAAVLLAPSPPAWSQTPPGPQRLWDPASGFEITIPAEIRNRSHGAIHHAVQSEDLLDQRLRRLKDLQRLQDLVQKILTDPKSHGVDPQILEKLKQDQIQSNGKAAVDPNDPQVRALLEKILGEHAKQVQPNAKISPEQVEAWQRLRPRPREEPPATEPSSPQVNRPPRVAPVTPPAPSAERPKRDSSGPVAAPAPEAPEPTPERRQLNPQVAEQFRKFLDNVRTLDPAFRNSPALRQAMQSMQNYRPVDDRWSGLANQVDSIQERFGDWTGKIRLDGMEGKMDWLSPRRLTPRSLPGFNWLGGRGSWMRLPSIGGPAISAPQASGEAVGWLLVWVVGLVGAGVIGWKVLTWRQAGAGRFRAAGRLGSWPVHPAAIQSAEEFILAFEYLSVLRLGTLARCWNHLAIAAGLAGEPAATVEAKLSDGLPRTWKDAPDRILDALPRSRARDEQRLAAAHLAALYEQARYAPPGDPLAAAALAAARRDLCFLGGVPAT